MAIRRNLASVGFGILVGVAGTLFAQYAKARAEITEAAAGKPSPYRIPADAETEQHVFHGCRVTFKPIGVSNNNLLWIMGRAIAVTGINWTHEAAEAFTELGNHQLTLRQPAAVYSDAYDLSGVDAVIVPGNGDIFIDASECDAPRMEQVLKIFGRLADDPNLNFLRPYRIPADAETITFAVGIHQISLSRMAVANLAGFGILVKGLHLDHELAAAFREATGYAIQYTLSAASGDCMIHPITYAGPNGEGTKDAPRMYEMADTLERLLKDRQAATA